MPTKSRKKKTAAVVVVSAKFRKWIEETGETQIAADLGVTQMAVAHWRRGISKPDSTRLKRIIELSDGALTYADIIVQVSA